MLLLMRKFAAADETKDKITFMCVKNRISDCLNKQEMHFEYSVRFCKYGHNVAFAHDSFTSEHSIVIKMFVDIYS